MKKILLLLLISIGLIGLVYYELENDKATAATLEAQKAAILDAELKIFEDELKLKLALQAKEVEIKVEITRQAALDAFLQKLADEKAAAAASTAAYLDKLLDEELAAFEAQLEAELVAQEAMARQAALDTFLQKLADEKAAAAKSTDAYQSKRTNDARVAALMADLSLEQELATFETKLAAELASQEMMAEIEAEMARQAALDTFLQKLADEKAAAAASTEAYRVRLISEAIEKEIDDFEAQLMEDLLEESTGVEIIITGEIHNLCKSTLGLSETNVQLFKKALSGQYLFSTGPQGENGTEFSSTRWDNYISCISSLNNEL